jgi:hypothetical protein
MQKGVLGILCVIVASSAMAQGFAQMDDKKSWAYHAYREEMTEPQYGLAKIKALIKKVRAQGDFKYAAPKKDFDALTFEEKFTYTMLHGELWMQICAGSFPVKGEEQTIFSQIPNRFPNDELWSDGQRAFLKKNRDKVVPLIRTTMMKKTRAGLNVKQAILETNATELIPELIQIYKHSNKDHDILTVLMNLMKEAKYKPFISSDLYQSLYGKKESHYEGVKISQARVQFVLGSAQSFYMSKNPPRH